MKTDIPKARSLLEAATQDTALAQELPITKQSRRTIVRNIYEAFRMLGEARLALAGIPHADHDTQIKELLRLDVQSKRPLQAIQHLKQLRHAVNYKGYQPDEAEAKDAQQLAKDLFKPCREAIQKEIETYR